MNMRPSQHSFENRSAWHRIGKFLVVGVLGTLIDFTLFALLHTLLGVPTLLANTLAYSAGIINNFILHRHWTFQQTDKTIGTQFSQFTLVSLGALLINNLLVLSLAPSFEMMFAPAGYAILLAKICATGIGLGWNLITNSMWTFRNASHAIERRHDWR